MKDELDHTKQVRRAPLPLVGRGWGWGSMRRREEWETRASRRFGLFVIVRECHRNGNSPGKCVLRRRKRNGSCGGICAINWRSQAPISEDRSRLDVSLLT